jgi:hypothetical protein
MAAAKRSPSFASQPFSKGVACRRKLSHGRPSVCTAQDYRPEGGSRGSTRKRYVLPLVGSLNKNAFGALASTLAPSFAGRRLPLPIRAGYTSARSTGRSSWYKTRLIPQSAANLRDYVCWPTRLAGLRLEQALIKRFAVAWYTSRRSGLPHSKHPTKLHLQVINSCDCPTSNPAFNLEQTRYVIANTSSVSGQFIRSNEVKRSYGGPKSM